MGLRALLVALALALALAVAAVGCSVSSIARRSVSGVLEKSEDVFASDEDPELVRDAMPFALKSIETLLVESPEDPRLLMMACRGFTQYSYAFLHVESQIAQGRDLERAEHLRDRAVKMHLRAREHCLRRLALQHEDVRERLVQSPAEVLAETTPEEVDVLYWTGASWGAALSLAPDRPDLVADFPVVRQLLDRALALDPAFEDGAIHEALVRVEGGGPITGGSPEKAKHHFERAVALSGGRSPGPFVVYATSIALPAQDRALFVELLERALAIDPDAKPGSRVAILVQQKLARALLARVDDLFLTDPKEKEKP